MSAKNGSASASLMSINEGALENLIVSKIKEIASPVLTVRIKEGASNEVKRELRGVHKDFKKILYLISKGHHVYLWGPPGSGKSTAAYQVATALGVPFAYISLNPQTPESRLIGYMDAGGNYRKTPFFDVYTNGGVFCIDEQDNASAGLLTTLNSLLENGHGAFPNGIFKRHEKFVLVSTGNTNGRGANPLFPDRRPFDAAFGERFTFLEWPYDIELEKAICLQINPKAGNWFDWIQRLRSYCVEHHPKVLVSPRATFKGADYLKEEVLTPAEIVESVIFKGVDADTREQVLREVPIES